MHTKAVRMLLLGLAFGAVSMRGDVIFSNLTGTGTVTGYAAVCGPQSLACSGPGVSVWTAMAFTSPAAYSLTGAEVLVAPYVGGSNEPTFDAFLYGDSGGKPGSAIEQIGFALSATTAPPGSLVTANTIGAPVTLSAGSAYWLVLAPHSATSFIVWAGGGSPGAPFATSADAGQNWTTGPSDMQFRITGDPAGAAVPEPSSFVLLAGAAAVICGIRRRNSGC